MMDLDAWDAERSIPACTGEPSICKIAMSEHPVYPRVYGGTVYLTQAAAHPPGLSPRVRGNPVGAEPVHLQPGSIPACTGEPYGQIQTATQNGVYPRVYGGTKADNRAAALMKGLSPRVRGNPLQEGYRSIPARSIPACTGEPSKSGCQLHTAGVYPRVYGGTVKTKTSCGD